MEWTCVATMLLLFNLSIVMSVCYYIGARPADCASASSEMPVEVRALYLKSVQQTADGTAATTVRSPPGSLSPGALARHGHLASSGGGGEVLTEEDTRLRTQLYQSALLDTPTANTSTATGISRGSASGSDVSVGSPSGRSTNNSISEAMLLMSVPGLEQDMSKLRLSTDSGASASADQFAAIASALSTPDSNVTMKEGLLLLQRPNSKGLHQRHVVLNRKQLVYFNASGKTAAGAINTDRISRVYLRAATDFAIEITVDSGDIYTLLADTMQSNEEWMLALLQTVNPIVRDQLVPAIIHVGLPNISGTDPVPVALDTTAINVIKYLRDKFDDPRFDACSLCLRRGDRFTWLNDNDRVLTTSVIFQSHVLECRKNSERDNMDRVRAATMQLQRPHDVEGYMLKLGDDAVIKAWRKRFFFSKGLYLFYAKNHVTKSGTDTLRTSSETYGFINLENSTSIDSDPNPRSSIFDIFTPGRIYRLQAANREEMMLWIVSLRRIREFQRQQTSEMSRIQSWSSIQSPTAFLSTKRDGMLWKRGGMNRAWKERFIILTDGYLSYYELRESTKQYKGSIPLAGSHVVVLPDEDAHFSFSIVTANRTYILHAESQASLEDWLEAINKEKIAASTSLPCK